MRQLSRHRGPVRPLLRVLRSRAVAWPTAPDLVAAVAASRAGAAGCGIDRRHLVGANASGEVKPNRTSLPLEGRGLGERGPLPMTSSDSDAVRIRRSNYDVPSCDARKMNRRGGAEGRPAASARAHVDTRCRPRVRASIAGLRRRAPQDREPRAGRRALADRRCDAPRPGPDIESLHPRTGRQPRRKYRASGGANRPV